MKILKWIAAIVLFIGVTGLLLFSLAGFGKKRAMEILDTVRCQWTRKSTGGRYTLEAKSPYQKTGN